jgi:hypothetical protein
MWRLNYYLIPILFALVFLFTMNSKAGEGIGETAWPDNGGHFLTTISGGGAVTSTLTKDTYIVLFPSLAEELDKSGCFTTSSTKICYDCARDFQAYIELLFTMERASGGTGTDEISFAFGIDTGTILDGDEVGEKFILTFTTDEIGVAGHISHATTLSTNECISAMGKIDNDVGGMNFSVTAASLNIFEP